MAFTLPEGYEEYYKKWEEKIGAFIEFCPEKDVPHPLGASGVALPFAVKDNIAVEGFSLSCGSRLLEDLKAPYTATAVKKLIEAGYHAIGKTNLDEFAMGSSTDNSGIKKTCNPWDTGRVAGGSSGGSAAAVAAGLVPFALGSDTTGSVRQPAAFCGVVGLKPTYGAVSRYGLMAHGSSLEGIGILSDTVERCRRVFGIIRGRDPMDGTSRDAPAAAPALYGNAHKPRNGSGRALIGVLSPEGVAKALASAADSDSMKIAREAAKLEEEVLRGFKTARANLQALGYDIKEVELPSLGYCVPACYAIACAEASANLARFDGIRFGRRPDWANDPDDLVDKARDAGFGNEVKLRLLLGTYLLRSGMQEHYYLPAQRIRANIKAELEVLLGDSDYLKEGPPFDALLLPVFPTRAFNRGALSPFAQKAAEIYTCCANLAGLPSLSFPASLEGGPDSAPLPVGIQLMGRAFSEGALLNIAREYEKAHPFPRPEGYKKFWAGEQP